MILGIGTDLVQVSRIESAMENPRFLRRLLTPQERIGDKGAEWVAGRWAAKEAAFKCLPNLASWQDVSVLSGPDGSPYIEGPPGRWWVSITHEGGFALAFVVLED
ncbi:MAG: holo-ACP synthase [Fimbriimonadaceae bacterium]|nr:holo-ACP synthase [Fimbriimonadaceae bacterium]